MASIGLKATNSHLFRLWRRRRTGSWSEARRTSISTKTTSSRSQIRSNFQDIRPFLQKAGTAQSPMMITYMNLWTNFFLLFGSGYSSTAERMPHDQDVMSSNPSGCCAFSGLFLLALISVSWKAPQGGATLLIFTEKFPHLCCMLWTKLKEPKKLCLSWTRSFMKSAQIYTTPLVGILLDKTCHMAFNSL